MTPEESFAARVKERRESMRLSQTRLAEVLRQQGVDLDGTAVTRIERGERRVRLNEAVAMVTVLGLDLHEVTAPHPGDLGDQIERAEVTLRNARYAANYWTQEAAAAEKRLAELKLQKVIDVDGKAVLDKLNAEREGDLP